MLLGLHAYCTYVQGTERTENKIKLSSVRLHNDVTKRAIDDFVRNKHRRRMGQKARQNVVVLEWGARLNAALRISGVNV